MSNHINNISNILKIIGKFWIKIIKDKLMFYQEHLKIYINKYHNKFNKKNGL